jgi:3D (Asp-Asp-Asp) domain-containing protein
MHATSYTAATSGKARSHPYFGITFTGMQAGFGIVAVDPKVVNLRSKLYVPGSGPGIAGDTGGRIKGLRIDLGYDESNLVLWYKWVDVYLLDPPPSADQIHYIIPDVPRAAQSTGR